MKKDDYEANIGEHLYTKFRFRRSTQKYLPLRRVLSLPGSSYENVNKIMAKTFDKIEWANKETNKEEAPETIENVDLDSCENISFYRF